MDSLNFIHELIPGSSGRTLLLLHGTGGDEHDLIPLDPAAALLSPRGKVMLEKLVAVGYSNGANIAAAVLLLRPEVLRAAILFRAMVPVVPENLPDLSRTRLWIGGGKQDAIIAPDETRRLIDLLREAGAEVTTYVAEAGHGLTSADLVMAKRWLATQ
ncbi:MAG: dienelactone hydrolase family protein [Chthoniobacterales bacterium]|nr:dienelactone hydrolase family protein [Chthoniobacterales bacterium]